ncbi:MAG TPA: hypothetical protein VFO95_18800 [Gemmatimonadales bacterium]|nr:hypothetical protein [Gemmatimonadales bacterium]
MVLASRGLRETNAGLQPVEDPEQRAALRRQARGIRFKNTVLALLVTVGVLLI